MDSAFGRGGQLHAGDNLLGLPARRGQENMVKWLISHGANPDPVQTDHTDLTPLHEAVDNNHFAIATMLVQAGANVNARHRWHAPIPEVGQWLGAVVRGHCQYYGIAGNARAIKRFRDEVNRLWHRALGRRSQKGQVKWERMQRLIERWIPPTRIVHPWPSVTFAVMTRSKSPVR